MLVPSYLGAHSAHPAPAGVCDQLDHVTSSHNLQVTGQGQKAAYVTSFWYQVR